jgi:hypothetical protein
MPNPTHRQRSAESFAGKARLESLTLRCVRDERRRIEDAFSRERADRPKLSLSRFLSECVANGLPGNLPSAQLPGADHERIALAVAEAIGARMSSVEAAVPFIADVLSDLAQRIGQLDVALQQTVTDTARVRELIESAIGGGDNGAGEKGDGEVAP